MKTFINILTGLFILFILYDIFFNNLIEGLTQSELAKETQKKIKSIEKDVKSIEKINPFAPCASLTTTVSNNTDQIKSMKDQVDDLKANCARQESA